MPEIYNSNKKNELEHFINLVAEEILQENMSVFLGAGSSVQYNFPNWSDLITQIYTGYKKGSNVDKAQYAELKGIDIKSEICKNTSLININAKETHTYLNYFLDFDFKSIWTTNYDEIIEKVLEQKSKKIHPIYKYSQFQQLSYPGVCFLFKINGSCNAADSIVITKEDFINYRKSHEAYLILLKRELLCHSFLFLGCSFEDDILRMCIKEMLDCIENSKENYVPNHFAIIAEKNAEKLEFISKDLARHYNIKCLNVSNPSQSYKIAYGIYSKVKYNSVFISGAKEYIRHSPEENIGKQVCQNLVKSFMSIKESPFKFISGMGMSIGHFICGTIKQNCSGENLNRYLEMEPFPFTSEEDNAHHREKMINKAGVFIFIFGDANKSLENSGMWKEYVLAKNNPDSIIIPLPCGSDSISSKIFDKELMDEESFATKYQDLLQTFDYKTSNIEFFNNLVEKVILTTREKLDLIIEKIENDFNSQKGKH